MLLRVNASMEQKTVEVRWNSLPVQVIQANNKCVKMVSLVIVNYNLSV